MTSISTDWGEPDDEMSAPNHWDDLRERLEQASRILNDMAQGALGQARERYRNDAEFHYLVYNAVEVVMGERESKILGGFRRTSLSVEIATEAAAVALHLADHLDEVERWRGCSQPYHCPCGCGAHVGCFLYDSYGDDK